ncbi:biliverdin-producing heme oxygenase [Salegentibacter maritimus]|uniref:Biliverdin-producing heme oxygenase n=1 Tax=Salegentibacter maritimus TaxID=2794347 RepID=A0ABS0TFH8_9FLAO|nr:biliverdin-producing heme oxygenase [Salegentibacter maritimus]MBI6119819.1 biliverdin-producing heme oxygenase [Salegentibacter maritimus]
MLNNLRDSTKKLHEDLEKENLAGQIISNDISLENYKLLLLQNYISYKITEDEIVKFIPTYKSDKSEKLAKDLEGLEVDASIYKEFKPEFALNSYEEALGAAYVVLGSALGGMYISKEVPNCRSLQGIPGPHFFSRDRDGVKSWNTFVKELKSKEFTEIQIKEASGKAKETFEFFGLIIKETSLDKKCSVQ